MSAVIQYSNLSHIPKCYRISRVFQYVFSCFFPAFIPHVSSGQATKTPFPGIIYISAGKYLSTIVHSTVSAQNLYFGKESLPPAQVAVHILCLPRFLYSLCNK